MPHFENLPLVGGGGGASLVIEEVDGSPTGAPTKLVFPNGTLSFVGGVMTYTPTAGATGTKYTNATSAPASPTEGDFWFNPTSGVKFTFINDGTSTQWAEV